MSKVEHSSITQYSEQEQIIANEISCKIFWYFITMDTGMILWKQSSEEKKTPYVIKNILWKMLTLIDSIIEDKDRANAIKSLVRQLIEEEREKAVRNIYESYKNS